MLNTESRVLTPDVAAALRRLGLTSDPDDVRALARGGVYLPVGGGAPDEDDDDGDGDGGDDDGDGDSGDGDDGDGSTDDEDDSDVKAALAELKQANRALSRRLNEETRARKKAEKTLQTQQRQEQEEAGEYKEMYEAEKRDHEALKGTLKTKAVESAVASVATRLKARNPAAIARLIRDLPDDVVDDDFEADEAIIEHEIQKLKRTDKYLFEDDKRQQDDVRGDAGGNGRRGEAGGRTRRDDADDDEVEGVSRMSRYFDKHPPKSMVEAGG